MLVSIAICTHNRARLLAGCLEALCLLEIPPGLEWEVVVVDNACTDETEETISGFLDRLPLRRSHEPRLGISAARNRALDAVAGELVLFTDDDTRPEPGWLGAHVAAMAEEPGAAFCGGPVEPLYLAPTPRWLRESADLLAGVLALRPAAAGPGTVTRISDASLVPFGANLGVRPAALDGLRFDPRLGRRGPDAAAGEETAFLLALLARGRWGIHVPGARVVHLVPEERLRPAYFEKWYRDFGTAAVGAGKSVPRTRLRLRLLGLRLQSLLLSVRRGRRWVRIRRRLARAEGMLAAAGAPRAGRGPESP